jgi:TolB-like protein
VLSEFDRLQAALPRRYTLVRELDRGGMSRVYLAREELPDRDVAIKVLDEELSARLGRERFVREVEVTSQLGHPYIVPIHSAGEAGGTLYYVMPHIGGASLRDRLGREGQLPIVEALNITRQVADALQYAHDKGVVHRDIKPSNILFQSGHAVVADFGIARALSRAGGDGSVTQSGLPIGTPDYMSPEQAAGEDAVDGRSDTYALACVLYEMLAGETPFHSRTSQATLARHLTDRMPSLRALRSAVPRGVEQVIAQALEKDPADRHATVRRFADALLVANRTGLRPIGPGHVARRWRAVAMPLRVASVLLMVAAMGIALQVWSTAVQANDRWEVSVAIMPFDNRTGDPAFNNLGLSLADEIASRLTSVDEVFITDPYTTQSAWKDDLGTPRLLEMLDVESIVHGDIVFIAGRLVVNVRESDASGRLIKRKQYEIDLDNIDAQQVTIADSVAQRFLFAAGLADGFAPGESAIGPGRDAIMAGNNALGQRTPAGMTAAVGHFREALAQEPRSAAALSALSSTYALALYYRYDVGLTSYELAGHSLAAADSAIAVNPDFANGYSARGYIRALLGIEIDDAEADFAMAEALAPNAPNGPSWSARILARKKLYEEAFSEARRARDLDPLQAGRRTALASLGFQLGRYDVTIVESREAYRLEERLTLAKAFEGRALAVMERGNECLSLDLGVYEVVRALCLYDIGQEQEAREVVLTAERQLNSGGFQYPEYLPVVTAQDLASFYGFIGEARGATRWMTYAFDLSPAGVDERILGSALFDKVREDAEFAEALDNAMTLAGARVEEARLSIGPVL